MATTAARPTAAGRGGLGHLRRQETLAGYLFLLPNIIGFLIFSSIPVVMTFGISLFDWDLIRAPRFVGIDNYVKLLTADSTFIRVLRNTGYYVFGTVPTVIIMAVWKNLGYNMVIFLAGLQGIPAHLYEAAAIDGANSWARFRHITL